MTNLNTMYQQKKKKKILEEEKEIKKKKGVLRSHISYLHSPGTEQLPCNRLQPCLQIAEKKQDERNNLKCDN